MLGQNIPPRGPQGGPAGELYTPDGGKTWLEKPPAASDTQQRAAEIRQLISQLPADARGEFDGNNAPEPARPVYAGPTPAQQPAQSNPFGYFTPPQQNAGPQFPPHQAYAQQQNADPQYYGDPQPQPQFPPRGLDASGNVVPMDQTSGQPSTDPNVNENAPFSHWLHLADGSVRKSLGVVTHWHENDDPKTPGIPIVAAVANPAYVQGAGDMKARVRSLLAELAGLTGIDLSNLANTL